MGTKTQKLSNVVDQIVEWQSVVVADGSTNTTGVSGRGYFIDTSAGTHTINLPASPKIGDVIKVSLITAGNDLTIGRNGNNINGSAADLTVSVDGDAYELVYVNASEGWKSVGQIQGATFISATGGTVLTSGDFKTHVFTGDDSFVVSGLGNNDTVPLGGPNVVDYLVVAGGGGAGGGRNNATMGHGSGSGAGGMRLSNFHSLPAPTTSPLAISSGITVTVTSYPITVGAGGSGGVASCANEGAQGSNSVFSTITSTGGGGGLSSGNLDGTPVTKNGNSGGSGGGAGNPVGTAGSGNTPPVSPPQGNNGGGGSPDGRSAGGGGAGAAGSGGAAPHPGNGGDGSYLDDSFFGPTAPSYGTPGPVGSTRYFAGGGAGSAFEPQGYAAGSGGAGGGAPGGGGGGPNGSAGNAGTANTGGGSSNNQGGNATNGNAGGKGIVIIRYKYQ